MVILSFDQQKVINLLGLNDDRSSVRFCPTRTLGNKLGILHIIDAGSPFLSDFNRCDFACGFLELFFYEMNIGFFTDLPSVTEDLTDGFNRYAFTEI